MTKRVVFLLACWLWCGVGLFAAQSAPPNDASETPRGPFVMERGGDGQSIRFPRDEELVYRVALSLGVLGSPTVGHVTMTSKVEPFFKGGVVRNDALNEQPLEQAIVSARAAGNYAVYEVEQTIATRVMPQLYPRMLHTSVQTGTENRRRELSIGSIDGVSTSAYRSDGHCKGCDDRRHFVTPTWPWQDAKHCRGCKRAEHRYWRDPRKKDVPDGSLDMVSAVMLLRTVIEQGKPGVTITLLDTDKLWEVEIARGRRTRRKSPAGEFDVVEVLLKTRPPPGEAGRSEEFSGLFGLHGSISVWVHPESGVPVAITGVVPAGPVELDVDIELESYRGTPAAFRPVIKAANR